MPIQVTLDRVDDDASSLPREKLNNVSSGGLAFLSTEALSIGKTVKVRFPLLDQQHCLTGKVIWSKPNDQGFETGLQFEDPNELFCLRMIEQICHIEDYRSQLRQQQGRQLSSEEAATEWISLYAAQFPGFD